MEKRKIDIKSFVNKNLSELSTKLKGKKVLCALSGGVDSAVVAALINKAAHDSLTCVFVDTGLMRKNEPQEIKAVFKDQLGINLIMVDAVDRFLKKLAGVTEPEKKRKIIGEEFIRVFEQEAKKIGKVNYLAQGTIYPDIIESGVGGNLVKSHHNVGGLPGVVDFDELIEPLNTLYKAEVRAVGLELGLPKSVVMRQPFPGPGLGVRVLGEITKEKLNIVREADAIYLDEIKKAKLETKIWQYFAVLPGIMSVGVKSDKRLYGYTIALRAVNTEDAMTATFVPVPYDVLTKVSRRITDEIEMVNRVVFDITNKPPSTIEWE